jgi:hypothetical protein
MAKSPPSDDKKTERLHMLISPSELDAIDDWRFSKRIGTRAEAVRRLCQIGLAWDTAQPKTREFQNAINETIAECSRAFGGESELGFQFTPSIEETRDLLWRLIVQNFDLMTSLMEPSEAKEIYSSAGDFERLTQLRTAHEFAKKKIMERRK